MSYKFLTIPRAAKAASRLFSTSRTQYADFTHAVCTSHHIGDHSSSLESFHQVIGAGAVGLAIARQLAAREGTSTILIERHGSAGTETSSRNSEVCGYFEESTL
jgi:2-hydroxyglutarate dehydrogenase